MLYVDMKGLMIDWNFILVFIDLSGAVKYEFNVLCLDKFKLSALVMLRKEIICQVGNSFGLSQQNLIWVLRL